MPGPVFNLLARRVCRRKLLETGKYSRWEIQDALDDLDDDVIDVTYASVAGASAIGDGKILDAIIAWFQSEQGKAFIDALLKILLALLTLTDPP